MIQFSSKARTLKALETRLATCKVLPQECFTVQELERGLDAILSRVKARFPEQTLIVRSSAQCEDTQEESNAGSFLSILNVTPAGLREAICKVAGAFEDANPLNEIFVQPMLLDTDISGVVFTVDPNTGGNYFVINYDEKGATDAVTSGQVNELQTCYVFHGHKTKEPRLDRLILAATELMGLFAQDNLDIEFALTGDGDLYVLQVRPLVLSVPVADIDAQRQDLERTSKFIEQKIKPMPYVCGKRTIYGVMPDWNPAEMIGIRPRPLAVSMYKRLITDGTWAYQRDMYGYRNLRSFPLMLDFCGMPYIDTRVTFNSFIPKNLDASLSESLVDYYLDYLGEHPDAHDKVEFEIVLSCYTFDLPQRLEALGKHGFTPVQQQELANALRSLTNGIINTRDGLWITDSKKIEQLVQRHKTIMDSDLDNISKIYWLTEYCARYGTLPFAGLARAGFIAVLLLQSLVTTGILSDLDYQAYMGSLDTVGSQLAKDRQNLSLTAFMEKYGHLRPGTYDITSPCYRAAPELYFGQESFAADEAEKAPFSLTLAQYEAIQLAMTQHGLEGDVLALFKFLKAGIEGREHAKFVFTNTLSDSLELIAALGAEYGFSREDMSYFDLSVVTRLFSSTDDIQTAIARCVEAGKEKHAHTLGLTMPPVIQTPQDIFAFHLPSSTPNYITLHSVTGTVCSVLASRQDIEGKILLIQAADPGFDWIFSCRIKGLITAYGGANSHMAIRAGELGIPAVIGAGEKLFRQWSTASTLRIDCANKRVEVLG